MNQMPLSSSIFSSHTQESLGVLIQVYVKATQNGCDLNVCFKSMRCLLPSWCYHTKVLRIFSCLFYSKTPMSTQGLSVKLVGLNRRFGRVAQRAVSWAKNLCVHMGTFTLLVWSYLSDEFCHVEHWSLILAHLSCTIVALNSPMLVYNGDTRQKHRLGKLRPRLVATVIEILF